VSLNKLGSEVVPASAGCLCDGAGVLVGRTNRAPNFMTVTPRFYQNVRWALLLLRRASVAVEVAGAIRIFSAYLSLVKRLNTSFLNCVILLLYHIDVVIFKSKAVTARTEKLLLFVVLNDTNWTL